MQSWSQHSLQETCPKTPLLLRPFLENHPRFLQWDSDRKKNGSTEMSLSLRVKSLHLIGVSTYLHKFPIKGCAFSWCCMCLISWEEFSRNTGNHLDSLVLFFCKSHIFFLLFSLLIKSVETRVQSLGREDPVEKGMATHSNILAWRIPWTEKRGRLQSTGSQRVGQGWARTCMKLS